MKPFGFYGKKDLPNVEISHEIAKTIIQSCIEEAGQPVFEMRLADAGKFDCFSSKEEFDAFMDVFIMEPKASIQWAAQFLEDC